MEKLKYSPFGKGLCIFAASASAAVSIAGLALVAVMYSWGSFDMESSFLQSSVSNNTIEDELYSDSYEVASGYFSACCEIADSNMGQEDAERIILSEYGSYENDVFVPCETNVKFSICDADNSDEVIYDSGVTDNCCIYSEYCFQQFYDTKYNSFPQNLPSAVEIKMSISDDCLSGSVKDKYYYLYRIDELFSGHAAETAAAVAVLSLLSLVLFVRCMFISGRRGFGEKKDSLMLKLPIEIYLLVSVVFCALPFIVLSMMNFSPFAAAVCFVCVFSAAVSVVSFGMAAAGQIKLHVFVRRSPVCRLVRAVYSLTIRALKFLGRCISAIPTVWPAAAVLIVSVFMIGVLTAGIVCGAEILLPLLVVFCLFLLCFTVSLAWDFDRITSFTRTLSEGRLDSDIDTGKMLPVMRREGDNLNRMKTSLNLAVNERMKSERFKTELITNVSHDLKTPLTSIINYTDLLAKEPLDEKSAEYVKILERQSQRLRKLIDDLTEASKAATGCISVTVCDTNLTELLGQAAAEYTDRFAKAGLIPVIEESSEAPIWVTADGKYTWRIIDNILSNISKYSLKGTRVYIEAGSTEKNAVITFKNVSRDKLNIPAGELMERFVRGDRSRGGEGSGLGLGIAQSLAEAQNGSFSIETDGDLFKSILTLPLCEKKDLSET